MRAMDDPALRRSRADLPIEALLFLVAVLVIGARSIRIFIHPVAGWEDATQGIDVYASHAAPIFHRYAGYVSVLPNLVDWGALRLCPLRIVPYVQASFALAMAALVPPAIFHAARLLFGLSRGPAILIALSAGLAPLGDVSLISNTAFSIWSMLAVLLLRVAAPVPRRPAAWAIFVVWRVLFALSNPVSLLAAPAWAILAWYRRADRVACLTSAGLAGVSAAYILMLVDHRAAPLHSTGWIQAIFDGALRLGVERSLLDIVLRSILRVNDIHLPLWALAMTAAAVPAGMAAIHRIGRMDGGRAMGEALVLPSASLAVAALCAIGRGAPAGSAFLLDAPRYQAVPKLFWLIALAVLVITVWRGIPPAWPGRRMVAIFAVACLSMVWGKGLKAYAWHDTAQSAAVERFLSATDDQIAAGGAGPFDFRRVDRFGDWSFHIQP